RFFASSVLFVFAVSVQLLHSSFAHVPSNSIVCALSLHDALPISTCVGAVSEIMPLTTEAVMTDASAGIDDLGMTPLKSTTTVARSEEHTSELQSRENLV